MNAAQTGSRVDRSESLVRIVVIETASAYLRLQAEVERTQRPQSTDGGWVGFPTVTVFVWPRVTESATESVRCRPRTTRGGGPTVVRTAMTQIPMGPV